MHLVLPNYQSIYSETPIQNAVGYISLLTLDTSSPQGSGRIMVNINMDGPGADSYLPPIGQASISMNQTFDTGERDENGNPVVVTFPDLSVLMSDPDFAVAFATIRTKLYTELQKLPLFAGSTLQNE
jgi:hypothetical protein